MYLRSIAGVHLGRELNPHRCTAHHLYTFSTSREGQRCGGRRLYKQTHEETNNFLNQVCMEYFQNLYMMF